MMFCSISVAMFEERVLLGSGDRLLSGSQDS